MAIVVACTACNQKLKVKEELIGRKAKCPACGGVFLALEDVEPVTEDHPVLPSKPAARLDAAARSKARPPVETPPPKKKPAPPPEPEPEPEPEMEDEAPAESQDEAPRKKKKKKRKKRRQEEEGGAVWPWLAVGGVLTLCFVLFAVLIVKRGLVPHEVLLEHGIYLAVMMPISVGILILSAVISSMLGGGMEFGDPWLALVKAFILILITNVLSNWWWGCWLNGLVWLIGLIVLFRLDLWEAQMVSFVNWFLNVVAGYVAFAIILSIIAGGRFDPEDLDLARPGNRGRDRENQVGWTAEEIRQHGGKLIAAKNDPDEFIELDFSNTKITDADIPKLERFTGVRRLNLANTPITDAAIQHLEMFDSLDRLNVSGTKITPAGIQQLRRLMPDTKSIIYEAAPPVKKAG